MNPEEMIREAQARGLTRNPTLILDVAPGESPAETIARMQRATEFVSGGIQKLIDTEATELLKAEMIRRDDELERKIMYGKDAE